MLEHKFSQLAYTSLASTMTDLATITEILNVSRINNERDSITGILLFNGGCFMQYIEGYSIPIYTLYEKLKSDRRHHSVKKIYDGETSERVFPLWFMAFENLERANLEFRNAALEIFQHTDSLKNDELFKTLWRLKSL